MDTSRHATGRSISSNELSETTDDLPCYGMEELNDFQISVPMPSRSRGGPEGGASRDLESTEEILAAKRERQFHETDRLGTSRRKCVAAQTLPISVARLPAATLPRQEQNGGHERATEQWRDGDKPKSVRTSITAGDVIADRYVVTEVVDHVGMGRVYKALDRNREKAGSPTPWVALKFARPTANSSTNGSTETSIYLRQEFLKLSQLNHPNIVSVFDFACDNGRDFIVMEWLSGETLASLLARMHSKRIALHKAADIVRRVARGLAHAHDLGIVHGDVKPSNIFLTDNRAVKVLDFGSSGKTTSDDEGDSEQNWATRAYASCEVLQGQPPQPHDDVFALGVTAYCLLSGERPFGNLDAVAARDQRVSPAPLPPDAHDSWTAVEHALKFDAIDRPGNAKVFLREFDDLTLEPAAPSASPPAPTVAYGALAAALLAALVWWMAESIGGLPPEVQTAIAKGDAALSQGRLFEPGQDSAFRYYSTVLEAAPENPQALEGLDRIAVQYLTRAREALRSNDLDAALADLAIAKKVRPGHFGIGAIEDLVERRGRDFLMAAQQAAEIDMDRAERLLSRAESLLAVDDPALLRVRAGLSQQKLETRLESLLQRVDDRILAERLMVPQGDSALDLLQRAQKLAPKNRKVSLAADRVVTALLFQAMFAISNGDLAQAESFINAAKSMGIEHLALARAEYELAKARRDALSASNARGRSGSRAPR